MWPYQQGKRWNMCWPQKENGIRSAMFKSITVKIISKEQVFSQRDQLGAELGRQTKSVIEKCLYNVYCSKMVIVFQD